MKKSSLLYMLILLCSCSSAVTINGVSTKKAHQKTISNRDVNCIAVCCIIGTFIGKNVVNRNK